MESMTSRERIGAILKRQKTDRIGVYEHFWGDTHKSYVDKGFLKPDESFEDHFGLEILEAGWLNMVLDLDFKNETVEEREDTVLIKDGNGAFLRRHKFHDTTPEHVDFTIKDRDGWNEYRGRLTNIDGRRIDYEGYRRTKARAKEMGKFFVWSGVNVFELMHPVCGHENMLIGMALDPDWIADMAAVFSETTLALQQMLFAKEGYPDGIWYYEDMGFKNKPFMSPAMYKELIFPAHQKTIAFAHAHNLPVIMHSCGYIEPLLPGMIEAGIDCLQVIEVKAGMDLLKLNKLYGDKISFMGGIDVRKLYTNDRAVIDAELLEKIPAMMKTRNYILHSDHSIPNTVDYDVLRYYFEQGKKIGTYR